MPSAGAIARTARPTVEIPRAANLASLAQAARACTACPLYQSGTQTVFGEGRSTANLFLVGEQPGDQEDVAVRPFIGPAGKLLDRALTDAGIARRSVYLTNAVKHLKWIPRAARGGCIRSRMRARCGPAVRGSNKRSLSFARA